MFCALGFLHLVIHLNVHLFLYFVFLTYSLFPQLWKKQLKTDQQIFFRYLKNFYLIFPIACILFSVSHSHLLELLRIFFFGSWQTNNTAISTSLLQSIVNILRNDWFLKKCLKTLFGRSIWLTRVNLEIMLPILRELSWVRIPQKEMRLTYVPS